MLRIRLSRTGKNRQPTYRIVVAEKTAPIKGRFVEALGYYLPSRNPDVFEVKKDRLEYWMSKGALPTDSVAVLLKNEGFNGMDAFIEPRNKHRKKKKVTEDTAKAPATEAAPSAAEKPVEAPAAEPEPALEEKPAEPIVDEEPAAVEEAPTSEEKSE